MKTNYRVGNWEKSHNFKEECKHPKLFNLKNYKKIVGLHQHREAGDDEEHIKQKGEI